MKIYIYYILVLIIYTYKHIIFISLIHESVYRVIQNNVYLFLLYKTVYNNISLVHESVFFIMRGDVYR